MKHNPSLPRLYPEPNENDIRNYAYHLYEQGNHAPGHDLDNWLEATACLRANDLTHLSSARLHWHENQPESCEIYAASAVAGDLGS